MYGAEDAGALERSDLIYNRIKQLDEEEQKEILESLDPSSYTKKELLDLVRRDIEKVKMSHISGSALVLYKDKIVIVASIVFKIPPAFLQDEVSCQRCSIYYVSICTE